MKILLLIFFLAGFVTVSWFREFGKPGGGNVLVLGGIYVVAGAFAALALWATRKGEPFFGLRRRPGSRHSAIVLRLQIAVSSARPCR